MRIPKRQSGRYRSSELCFRAEQEYDLISMFTQDEKFLIYTRLGLDHTIRKRRLQKRDMNIYIPFIYRGMNVIYRDLYYDDDYIDLSSI